MGIKRPALSYHIKLHCSFNDNIHMKFWQKLNWTQQKQWITKGSLSGIGRKCPLRDTHPNVLDDLEKRNWIKFNLFQTPTMIRMKYSHLKPLRRFIKERNCIYSNFRCLNCRVAKLVSFVVYVLFLCSTKLIYTF